MRPNLHALHAVHILLLLAENHMCFHFRCEKTELSGRIQRICDSTESTLAPQQAQGGMLTQTYADGSNASVTTADENTEKIPIILTRRRESGSPESEIFAM